MPRARRPRARRGVALLEVIVGLTLFAIAGVALLVMLTQATDSVRTFDERDAEARAVSAQLDRVALWTRDQLEGRIGSTRLGDWVLHVAALTPTLYRVALADTASGALVLETSLYRPDTAVANADSR
jgi:type II secretory pathway pseudopilin PulG